MQLWPSLDSEKTLAPVPRMGAGAAEDTELPGPVKATQSATVTGLRVSSPSPVRDWRGISMEMLVAGPAGSLQLFATVRATQISLGGQHLRVPPGSESSFKSVLRVCVELDVSVSVGQAALCVPGARAAVAGSTEIVKAALDLSPFKLSIRRFCIGYWHPMAILRTALSSWEAPCRQSVTRELAVRSGLLI